MNHTHVQRNMVSSMYVGKVYKNPTIYSIAHEAHTVDTVHVCTNLPSNMCVKIPQSRSEGCIL